VEIQSFRNHFTLTTSVTCTQVGQSGFAMTQF